MERTDQIIEELKMIVCDYYKVDPTILNDQSRKGIRPLLRQIISYFANTLFQVPQQKLADYWGRKTHSTICTSINKLIQNKEVSKRFASEITDIQRIITEKGLTEKSPKNNEWYRFVDLNNFVLATNGNKAILMVNVDLDELNLDPDNWKFEDQKETGKFYYSRLKQVNNQNK
jgi:hypothetical protein